MKFYLLFALVLAAYAVNVHADDDDYDDYCTGPNDSRSCKFNECCVKRKWPRTGYECEDLGDDINERCGGEYECGCVTGLTCVPDSSNFFNRFREGTGSCQRIGYRQG